MSGFYSCNWKEDELTITLNGDVKDSEQRTLRAVVREELSKTSCKKLIIDLSKVGYISSSGFGFFVNTLRFTNSSKIDFELKSPSKDVKKLFSVMNLDSVLKIT